MEFFTENIEWLFSGAGVALVAGVIALFRRKKATETSNLVIHYHSKQSNGSEEENISDSPIPIKKVSLVTMETIYQAISDAPPLMAEDVKKQFVGIYVEWDLYLKTATKREGGLVSLRLTDNPGEILNTINCEVLLEDYKELGILPKMAKIKVTGEIESAESFDVSLTNAKLYFYEEN